MEEKYLVSVLGNDNKTYTAVDFLDAEDYNKNLKIAGIVLQTEETGIVISIDEWKAAWQVLTIDDQTLTVPCGDGDVVLICSGRNRTKQVANASDFTPAAEYCWKYRNANLLWYLPSMIELALIAKYRKEINQTLAILDGLELIKGDVYWSCIEAEECYAWAFNFATYHRDWHQYRFLRKENDAFVRAVAKYEPLSNVEL